MERRDLASPASRRRLGLVRPKWPERAGAEPRGGEAGEEAASAAPPRPAPGAAVGSAATGLRFAFFKIL